MTKSEMEEYKEYVSARLSQLSPFMQSYALGDFSETIEIPEEEDEFSELLVGLTLMVDDIKEMIREKEDTIAKLERAEAELRKSEGQYRMLVETMHDGLAMQDTQGLLTFVNNRLCEMLGYSKEELLGKPWKNLFDEEGLRILKEQMAQRERGERSTYEIPWRTKDSRTIYTLISGNPVHDADGKLVGSFGVITDITERKRAEEALKQHRDHLEEMVEERTEELRESKQWLSTTLRSIGDAVIATDTQGLVSLMNPVAEELTGWNEAEAVGQPLEDVFNIINEQTGERAESPVARVLREGVVVGLANHTVLIAKDGTRRPIADSGALMEDEAGNIIGTVMVFRDITERRQAEEAVRKSGQLLQKTLYSLPDALFILDNEAHVVDCNPMASEIFGYSRGEMLGRTTAFLHVDEAALKEFQKHLYPVIEDKGFLSDFEFKMKRKDGTVFPSEHSVVPLEDEHGKRTGWVRVVSDITERKRAEEELRRVFDFSVDMLGIANMEGYFRRVNPSFEKVLGYPESEFLDRPFMEFVHPDDVARTETVMAEKLAKGVSVVRFENRYRCRDGSYRWLEWTAHPVLEEGLIYAVARDTTERKQTEVVLARARKD